MPKHDYTKLDASILAALSARPHHNANLMQASAVRLNLGAISNAPGEKAEPFRVLDRRLQALRKQNKIRYATSNGWSLVSNKA